MPRKKPHAVLTPELQAEICKAVELSVPVTHAAQANGIDGRTLASWLELGKAGTEPYAGFVAAISRARSSAVVKLTGRALLGAAGSSQALRLLERRYVDDYATGRPGADNEISGDLSAAANVRSNPRATRKLHEALALAAHDRSG